MENCQSVAVLLGDHYHTPWTGVEENHAAGNRHITTNATHVGGCPPVCARPGVDGVQFATAVYEVESAAIADVGVIGGHHPDDGAGVLLPDRPRRRVGQIVDIEALV